MHRRCGDGCPPVDLCGRFEQNGGQLPGLIAVQRRILAKVEDVDEGRFDGAVFDLPLAHCTALVDT
jgi:hypothetical protein